VLLTLTLPRIYDDMTSALIRRVHAAEGTLLARGAKLFDIRVDLSAAAPQDCPPISDHRIALREALWLRRLAVRERDEPAVDAILAWFSTSPDEALEGEPQRAVRIAIAGILLPVDWWDRDRP
jgi:hypothetical protein